MSWKPVLVCCRTFLADTTRRDTTRHDMTRLNTPHQCALFVRTEFTCSQWTQISIREIPQATKKSHRMRASCVKKKKYKNKVFPFDRTILVLPANLPHGMTDLPCLGQHEFRDSYNIKIGFWLELESRWQTCIYYTVVTRLREENRCDTSLNSVKCGPCTSTCTCRLSC